LDEVYLGDVFDSQGLSKSRGGGATLNSPKDVIHRLLLADILAGLADDDSLEGYLQFLIESEWSAWCFVSVDPAVSTGAILRSDTS
jgi:hypothetical protein